MGKPLLGEILVEKGEITSEQLQEAIAMQKQSGGLIGTILVDKGYISEEKLIKYLAIQRDMV